MSAPTSAPPGSKIGFYKNWKPDPDEYDEAFSRVTFEFVLSYSQDDRPRVAKLAAETSISIYDFEDDDSQPTFDERADWHHNTVSMNIWIRAHAYRIARDWQETKLAQWFNENQHLAREFGFTDDGEGLNRFQADPPSQSRLWEVWNEEFTPVVREASKRLAKKLFLKAYEHALPLPNPTFEREDREIESECGEQRLVREKTKEVWQQAKPFVTDSFYLKRAENWQVHENAFWEQHTFMGMREDMFAQSGQHSFAIDSGRDRTPSASNHRHQVKKLSIEETREMLRNTTRALIARARHNGELDRKISVAIDITKGNPFTGDRDGHEDVILGYKNAEYHYQWATIQVVGMDVPLVLDAIPVERGDTRAEIVDGLLGNATDMLTNISLVMMDREFDSDDVKDVCSNHGVYYLNPARKHASEKATCTQLRDAGRKVKVEEQGSLTGSNRKRMYLPARNRELFATDETPDPDDEPDTRQELVSEFADIGGDSEERGEMFSDLLDDLHEEEGELRGNDDDTRAYALFETNHPDLDGLSDADKQTQLQQVRSVVSRYSARWGIENGYKKLKKFRVRTTSKDPQYRFFNFAFACVLYNVWRLVDLLVKIALEDDPDYAPRVDANQFLTLAKQFYGLEPPD